MKKEPLKMIPYTIYLFTKQKVLYAVAKVELDNLQSDATFGAGFKLVKDKNSKLNAPANIYKRARRDVVARVSNALNAVQMFGEEAFDENGEIDWEKFQMEEFKEAFRKAGIVGSSYDKKIYDFKVIEIPLKVAKDNGLI